MSAGYLQVKLKVFAHVRICCGQLAFVDEFELFDLELFSIVRQSSTALHLSGVFLHISVCRL